MTMQENQEGWDFFKFQEELINDFALYEREFLAPYPDPEFAFDDPQQQQQLDLGADLSLEEMIEWLDHGRIVELETGQNHEPMNPLPPPHVEEQVDMVDEATKYRNEKEEFTRGLEENEKFLISYFPDPSFQRILFEIYVTDNHVEGGTGGGSYPKRRKKSPEEIKDCTIANEQQKTKRREAAYRYYCKKKKRIEDMCLQIGKLRMENKMRKKVVKFLEISKEVGTFPRRLVRATSGPLPSYSGLVS